MKSKLLALVLLATGSLFAGPRVLVGVGVGPVPAAYGYVGPVGPCPGPGYAWVDGYWYFNGGARLWHAGYWRAPYGGAYFGPRYYGPRYERGFVGRGHYEGGRGFERGYRR